MNQYTIVYEERWQSGGHNHCLTKIARVTGTTAQAIEKFKNVVFIFEGHPLYLGEVKPYDYFENQDLNS